MTEPKYQFASSDWVAFARSYVLAQSEGQDLKGINVSFCEIFTGAPRELDPDPDGRTGWYIKVTNGQVDVARGILPDPDLCITADYATVLPLARLVFAGNEKAAAEAQDTVAAAMADGRMTRAGDDTAMAQLPWLAHLHDALAARTA